MRSIHRANGLLLLLFIGLHLSNHLSGLWGIEAYNSTQNVLRGLYRNAVVEVILLGSIVLQLAIGVRLVSRGFWRKMSQTWPRVQAISALMVLYFVIEHLVAMAFARWSDGLDTNFYWPASVMDGAPFVWYFFPYYFLGVSALFVHVACYMRLYLLREKKADYAMPVFWLITATGVLIALTINLVLLGVFFNIELPAQWIDYLRVFSPDYVQK